MQPAPQQQLVALGSHQAAPKRLLEPLQQQQHAASANGVQQLLKAVSMGATLVGGSSGQPALFTIAPGMPPQASSLGQQQQQQQGQLAALGLAAHQGAFVQQGHQAATPVGVVVASRGTHAQLVNGPTGATAQVNSAQQIFLAAPQSTQLLLPSPPSGEQRLVRVPHWGSTRCLRTSNLCSQLGTWLNCGWARTFQQCK